jgi:thiosulfate/3-mercaptopyruvate sulfurtransferase
VRIALDDPDTILLDVRASDEWSGENRRDCMRGGRIPGAVHLEWKNFVTEEEVPVFKPADELIDMLTEKGVTRDKQIITY